MGSIYGKGVCTTTKNGKEYVQGHRVLVEAAAERAAIRRAARRVEDAGTTTSATPSATCSCKYVELANDGRARRRLLGRRVDVEVRLRHARRTTFEAEVDRLWGQVKPLYDQLHCYTRAQAQQDVRRQGRAEDRPDPGAPARQHVGAGWGYLYPELEPYKGVAPIDVTPVLAKSYDAKKMVQMGEALLHVARHGPATGDVLGALACSTKPAGKDVVCHASAWDVQYNNDLRIKMCINLNQEDLWTIHHELGHDYYFHAYYKLPILYQAGANDGFHEAIGDTIQLSMTPEYLKEKGLLDKVVKNDKATINHQMNDALDEDRVPAVRPDRRQVALGRVRGQGQAGRVQPALVGPDASSTRASRRRWSARAADFDPGAKYHVAGERPVHALLPRRGAAVPVPPRAVQEGRLHRPAATSARSTATRRRARRTRRCWRSARASRGRTRCSS